VETETTAMVFMASEESLKVTVDPRLVYETPEFHGTVQWIQVTPIPPGSARRSG
jgi:hypothetical protein